MDTMQRIINHVFLPPKLPEQADEDTEMALIATTSQALQSLQSLSTSGLPSSALNNAVDLLANMQPRSNKAGSKHVEYRDTASPAMISELFIGVLRGIGKPANVTAILKNTRDEVSYFNAKLPSRRSPMWLLIRVALQLVITRAPDGSEQLFKEVMVFIMSHILNSTQLSKRHTTWSTS